MHLNKIVYCLISIIFSFGLLSQETKTQDEPRTNSSSFNNQFKISRWQFIYNYYGFPFYLGGLYRYQKNSFYLTPYFKAGAHLGFVFPAPFAGGGIKIGYKRFYTDLSYRQQFIPDSVKGLKKEGFLLPLIGTIEVGQHFSDLSLTSITSLERKTYFIPHSLSSDLSDQDYLATIFSFNQAFEIYFPLIDDGIIKTELITGFSLNHIPKFKSSSWSYHTFIPVSLYHIVGNFSFKFAVYYTGYFKNSPMEIDRGTDFYSAYFPIPAISIREKEDLKYQFLSSLDLEYRVYFLFLPTPWDRFFFSVWGKLGYGKKNIKSTSSGRFLYLVGSGSGYDLNSVAIELQAGMDYRYQAVINLSLVSAIVHRP